MEKEIKKITVRNKELLLYYDLIVLNVNKYLKSKWKYREIKDDLIAEGTLGLMAAIETYEDDKGSSKVTYYSRGIRNYIYNYTKRLHKNSLPLVYIDSIHPKHLIYKEEVYVEEEENDLYERYTPTNPVDKRIYESIVTGSMNIKDIADEFSVSKGLIKMRKQRLLERIRKQMMEDNV